MISLMQESDVIRKAGKTTAVLQVFAVLLLGLLASLYYDISARYSEMQNGIRENAMWSVYQLDREARRLREVVSIAIAKSDTSVASQKEMSLRYDILFSRMSMLEKANFEENFKVDATVRKQLTEIRRTVYQNAPLFDDIAAKRAVSIASLRILFGQLVTLTENSEHLLTYTNNTLSADRADSRQTVQSLEMKSLTLIALLVASVGFLIFTLRRQLRSVRAAGLSLETMAGNLNNAYQAAEAGNRAKSQFMATMGHEIRTPLNAILGMVELMELKKLPAECQDNLRTIRGGGEALLDIINEILDFAKIEHGNLELEYRIVDIKALAESASEMMRGRAAEAGNTIDLDIPAVLSAPYIHSDPTRLRQIVLNLMSNAVKFTANGVVTLRIRETGTEKAPRLRIEVKDTGIGIDECGRAKLFKPFSQVDASISRKYGGTGLGLTICKQIVDRFGGEMGVDSVPGLGSKFWFEIPAPRSELAPPNNKAITAAANALPRLTVLAVEDNKVNQQVIRRFLEHLGQEVHLADDGAQAVDIASRKRFDLILMDMQMPVMDGIEATRRIKALPQPACRTPIWAMTANASEDDRIACEEAGMEGFHSKPVSMIQLRQLIADVGGEAQRPIADSPTAAMEEERMNTTAPQPANETWERPFELRRQEIADALGDDVFLELLDDFFDDSERLLRDLLAAYDAEQPEKLEPMLHNLKGAAANVGLSDIAALAQQMRTSRPNRNQLESLSANIASRKLMLAA
ncbi:signal transduction histidine kinase/CheY-like chemotaxis protein/HPt (histidine-containing phosphotransfer) domain-containing protein [Rhizobium sp. SG_E_25_P2]|uniref:ATP-binding protein n=1 Tax=Rhizobium sp. SG_E_25_P2 TaxID=2879942 RepID=UPI002472E8F2|nr:ATP-binding protein [Rhizobium sp. SG_E_25_P2]MDH6268943.1 signal transduction histidine kinase/CheY-like chemotaxis protein/HPt (histidine-containing phosphotransfer) domain-containing protein [Rhizobium sp. SG_E_25_P2]